MHTFILDLDNVSGATVTHLGQTKVPLGQFPILLYGGEVSLQTQSGKLVKVTLSSHDITHNIGDFKPEQLRQLLAKNLALGRLANGWAICDILDNDDDLESLSK